MVVQVFQIAYQHHQIAYQHIYKRPVTNSFCCFTKQAQKQFFTKLIIIPTKCMSPEVVFCPTVLKGMNVDWPVPSTTFLYITFPFICDCTTLCPVELTAYGICEPADT